SGYAKGLHSDADTAERKTTRKIQRSCISSVGSLVYFNWRSDVVRAATVVPSQAPDTVERTERACSTSACSALREHDPHHRKPARRRAGRGTGGHRISRRTD